MLPVRGVPRRACGAPPAGLRARLGPSQRCRNGGHSCRAAKAEDPLGEGADGAAEGEDDFEYEYVDEDGEYVDDDEYEYVDDEEGEEYEEYEEYEEFEEVVDEADPAALPEEGLMAAGQSLSGAGEADAPKLTGLDAWADEPLLDMYDDTIDAEEMTMEDEMEMFDVSEEEARQQWLTQRTEQVQFRLQDERARPAGPGVDPDEKEGAWEDKVVSINRVCKVVRGGRDSRIRAVVVCGNMAGQVGYGVASAKEVAQAIQRASKKAKATAIHVPITRGRSIPHKLQIKKGAARIMLRPARPGTGIIAGGAVRIVLEMAGYQNCFGKIYGTSNAMNNARGTMHALSKLTTWDEVLADRGVSYEWMKGWVDNPDETLAREDWPQRAVEKVPQDSATMGGSEDEAEQRDDDDRRPALGSSQGSIKDLLTEDLPEVQRRLIQNWFIDENPDESDDEFVEDEESEEEGAGEPDLAEASAVAAEGDADAAAAGETAAVEA